METGEAMASRQGIRTTIESSFNSFILEMDSMLVFEAFKRRKKESSEFGLVLNDINMLLQQCTNVSFTFVRRNGNMVAHRLAKRNLITEFLLVWLEETPEDVMEVVASDLGSE